MAFRFGSVDQLDPRLDQRIDNTADGHSQPQLRLLDWLDECTVRQQPSPIVSGCVGVSLGSDRWQAIKCFESLARN